jgi:ribosomal-protein-alanine N-acetyltransferase
MERRYEKGDWKMVSLDKIKIGKIDLLIRYPKMSDLKDYQKNKNDKLIAQNYVFFNFPYGIKDARTDLKKMISENKKKNGVNEFFVVEMNGEVIGEIALGNIIPKLKAKTHSWIGKEFRGKGIMTKVRKEFTKYAFKRYKLRRIYALCRTHNKASARVLEKSGFKREGLLKKDVLKCGKYYDSYQYALVK